MPKRDLRDSRKRPEEHPHWMPARHLHGIRERPSHDRVLRRGLTMKILLLIALTIPLLADSKTQELQSRITAQTATIKALEADLATSRANADQRVSAVLRDHGSLTSRVSLLTLQNANLKEENTALQSQLRSQLDAAKFQSGAVKALATAEHDRDKAVAVNLSSVNTAVHLATARHEADTVELKKGTSAASTAAQESQRAAWFGEANRNALIETKKRIVANEEVMAEIRRSEVMSSRLQVILVVALIAQFAVVFAFRGRKTL